MLLIRRIMPLFLYILAHHPNHCPLAISHIGLRSRWQHPRTVAKFQVALHCYYLTNRSTPKCLCFTNPRPIKLIQPDIALYSHRSNMPNTPMTGSKKLANFNEALNTLRLLGPIETLTSFLIAHSLFEMVFE